MNALKNQYVWDFQRGFKSRLAHHLNRNPVVIETTGFSLYTNGLRDFDAIGITIHLSHF